MKMKKIWRGLAVLLIAAGTVLSSGQAVHAATLTDVTDGLDSTGNGRIPNEGGYDDGVQSFLSSTPTVTIKANGLKPFGSENRISTSTTQINVAISGTMTTKPGSPTVKPGNIMSYYFDILDRNGKSFTTPSQVISVGFKNTSVTINQNITFDVDLKDLKTRGPIYIAYCFTTDLSKHVNKYYSVRVGKKLSPTITTSPVTTGTTVLSGTGTSGDLISNSVTGDTTTVGDDGKWMLNLTGDALKGASGVTVAESNEFGDYGTMYSFVTVAPVTIAADKTTLNLSSDDVTKLEAMSDSDFADWVKSEANITGKSSSGSSADVKTDTTDLAAALKKVAANDSMPIDFYATDGTNKSATKTITLVKPGTVKFGTISSDIDFGSHGVPTATALYGPSSAWNVNINDTRTTGSKWYLYASATDLTSGSHKMPGYLTYRDANGQTSDLTKSTLIDSGDRGTSDTTDVTSNWTTDPKDTSKAGIFLDVEPGVFADSSIKYSGAVNWTLSDVPTP
ncbi:hypothetical protein [Lactiplantibacillus paraxiangfangensis]|uniref:hypothetical protein n=1 Tax=Lactiplantibacillus paraxiangfangensis TaxID=3076224 RepID=UPI0030C6BDD2